MIHCILCGVLKTPDQFIGIRGKHVKSCIPCREKQITRGMDAGQKEVHLARFRTKLQRSVPTDKPQRMREYRLRHWYGIEPEQYENMLKAQDGKCAICLKPPSSGYLCIDHNLYTREVRGLLCHSCNKGLGHFFESLESLKKAIEYLGGTQK